MCSNCGGIKHNLILSDRIYYYDKFDLFLNSDMNVTINISNIGLTKVGKGIPEFTHLESAITGPLKRRSTSRHSMNQEPQMIQLREGCYTVKLSIIS